MKRRNFVAGLSALVAGFVLDETTGLFVPHEERKKMWFVPGRRELVSDPVFSVAMITHDETHYRVRSDVTQKEIDDALIAFDIETQKSLYYRNPVRYAPFDAQWSSAVTAALAARLGYALAGK